MRETRRSLKAKNIELQAKLSVHDHTTRRSLHDMLKGIEERNKHLVFEIGNLQRQNETLEAELILAKAEKVAA